MLKKIQFKISSNGNIWLGSMKGHWSSSDRPVGVRLTRRLGTTDIRYSGLLCV